MSSDPEAEIRASVGGQGLIILLIWAAIAIINVAYARHS